MEYLAAIVFALLGLIEFAFRVVLVLPLTFLTAMDSSSSLPVVARETLTPFLWRLAEESITTERR